MIYSSIILSEIMLIDENELNLYYDLIKKKVSYLNQLFLSLF
jgi:hypothetical protein